MLTQGASNLTVNLQLCFLPTSNNPADSLSNCNEVHILQTFIELDPAVAVEKINDVLEYITHLNDLLPFGHFGLMGKTLYFKHNCLLNTQAELQLNRTIVDQQSELILHLLNLFTATLLALTRGNISIQTALDQTL